MTFSLKNLLVELKTNCGNRQFELKFIVKTKIALIIFLSMTKMSLNVTRIKQTFPTQEKPLFQEDGKNVWRYCD